MRKDSRETYCVPNHIAWIDGEETGLGDGLYLTEVPGGQTVLLNDTARLIWLAAAAGERDVATRVAAQAGLSAVAIRSDVESFLADLSDRGLLSVADPTNER